MNNFEEAYCGELDSEEDFARHIVEECYNLERTMGGLSNYFDYEAFFARQSGKPMTDASCSCTDTR